MSIRLPACVVSAVLLLSVTPSSAGNLVVDLAAQEPGTTESETIAPGSHRVLIVNRLPDKTYSVVFDVEYEPLEPLQLPTARPAADDFCANAPKLLGVNLAAAADEKTVANDVALFRAKAVDEGCTDSQVATLESYIMQKTTRLVPANRSIDVARGFKLVVVVRRLDASGVEEKRWERVFTTGKRGEWRVTYGFNFIPNEDETFFTEQSTTDPSMFVVTQESDRKDLDFAPSVFFTWLPAEKRGRPWSWGPTAGLGFDLDDPVVFAGVGGTFNENIMLSAGIVFHKQARLTGRFEPGQIIGTNLDPEQLTEQTYNVNFYFGIGFRFGSSPYETTGGASGGD